MIYLGTSQALLCTIPPTPTCDAPGDLRLGRVRAVSRLARSHIAISSIHADILRLKLSGIYLRFTSMYVRLHVVALDQLQQIRRDRKRSVRGPNPAKSSELNQGHSRSHRDELSTSVKVREKPAQYSASQAVRCFLTLEYNVVWSNATDSVSTQHADVATIQRQLDVAQYLGRGRRVDRTSQPPTGQPKRFAQIHIFNRGLEGGR